MRRFLVVSCSVLFVSLIAGPSAAQIELPDGFWDHGDFDRDDLIDPPLLPPPVVLASYDFEGCSNDGWTTHDLTVQGPYFHIDNFSSMSPPYGALAGTKSLWCGARSSTIVEPTCSYASLPGYGNRWDQRWTTKTCPTVTGTVTVAFTARWDLEANYDFALVEWSDCAGNWTAANGTIGAPNITGVGGPTAATFSFTGHSGQAQIRLRVVTDTGYSDEDGDYNSSGALVVDNLRVDDDGGVVVALEDFEGEASPALESNDWAADSGEFGNYAAVVSGSTQPQLDPRITNLSCMWAFTSGPVNNFSCGHGSTPAVPKGPIDEAYILNEIWSPAIPFSGPTTYGTVLQFDVYSELPLDNLVFYRWRVRERLTGSTCWGAWKTDNFVYYSADPIWRRKQGSLTPHLSLPATISQIQVALGVVDMLPAWGGLHGSGTCHSHAPLIDNVEVHRTFLGRSYVPMSLTLFQDRFAGDGTLTGTVRMDGAEDDVLRVQIADAAAELDYLTSGVPSSGPAVFLHVKALPNKSGAVVSGGQQWPYVASMSDPDWTVLQMAASGVNDEYNVDLNDELYQPGDVVQYYFSSRNQLGEWTYWSHFTGNRDEVTVRQHAMEATCLPYPPSPNQPRALYIDGTSGLGAQPLIENSMGNIGLVWDRFDRNEPLQDRANSIGNLIVDPLLLGGYEFILWDTGDVSDPFTDLDYNVMYTYLSVVPDARLYITGAKAARAIATSSSQAAALLRSNFITFNLTTDDHKSLGLPLSPLVSAVAQGPFSGQFYAFVGDGSAGKFDVMSKAGSSTIGMYYGNDQNAGALLYQQGVGASGPVKVVLSSFGLHSVADDEPNGIPDRTALLDQALQYLGTPGSPPTNTEPVPRDYLEQNHPNPFNPTTTIRYALSAAGRVSLRIYDVTGAVTRTLVDDAHAAAGPGEATWNGRDDRGEPVASGVYFYRLESPNLKTTKKMVLLK